MPEIQMNINRGETTQAGAARAWVNVDGQKYDLIDSEIKMCESDGAWGTSYSYVCGTNLVNAQAGGVIDSLGLMSDQEIEQKAREIYRNHVRPKIQEKEQKEKKRRRRAA